MKRGTLSILACPSCGKRTFGLRVVFEDDLEVREGIVYCTGCGAEYPVRAGMVDLLHDPSLQVRQEMEAWESLRPDAASSADNVGESRSWLLALPMLVGKEGPRQELETWRRHGRAVFDLMADEDWHGRKLLELGAGRCWLSAYLSRLGAEVVAVDILEDDDIGLGCAEAFLEEGMFFERVLCDMHHLPFRDGSFDAVAATATLHHSTRPAALLDEIARVLAPKGMLLAANEPLYVPWRETPEEERKGAHEGAYSLWGWLHYLRRSGFQVTKMRVGRDASLRLAASPAAKAGTLPLSELVAAAARYADVLALALPRLILREARRMKAGRPMRPAPRDRSVYFRSRIGLTDVRERALAGEETNWGPGWYGAEGEDEPFRWCGPRARLLLPPAKGSQDLVIELATFHPSPQADPTEVEVRVGGGKVGEIHIDRHGWKRFRLRIPYMERRRPVPVTIRVMRGYFVPSDMGLGEDRRLLGVACRGVWWED